MCERSANSIFLMKTIFVILEDDVLNVIKQHILFVELFITKYLYFHVSVEFDENFSSFTPKFVLQTISDLQGRSKLSEVETGILHIIADIIVHDKDISAQIRNMLVIIQIKKINDFVGIKLFFTIL